MKTDLSSLVLNSKKLSEKGVDADSVFNQMVSDNKLLHFFLEHGPSINYITNYKTLKYIYLSRNNIKNMLGFEPDLVFERAMEEGVRFIHKEYCHPADAKLMANDAFAYIYQVLNQTPQNLRDKVRFSVNWRILRSDGNYMQCMQQFHVISDPEDGLPILNIGSISDISHLKKDNKMLLHAHLIDAENKHLSFSKELIPEDNNLILSDREIEVAKFLMQGLNSENIAEKLFISPFTVKAHRRKIYEKLEVHKAAELGHKMLSLGLA